MKVTSEFIFLPLSGGLQELNIIIGTGTLTLTGFDATRTYDPDIQYLDTFPDMRCSTVQHRGNEEDRRKAEVSSGGLGEQQS
jgi:hypothetical protein